MTALYMLNTHICIHAARRAFDDLPRLIPVASLGEVTAERYAPLRAKLRKTGLLIGSNDLWIAAHAVAPDVTLVTNNTGEFDRLRSNMRVENWVGGLAGARA